MKENAQCPCGSTIFTKWGYCVYCARVFVDAEQKVEEADLSLMDWAEGLQKEINLKETTGACPHCKAKELPSE